VRRSPDRARYPNRNPDAAAYSIRHFQKNEAICQFSVICITFSHHGSSKRTSSLLIWLRFAESMFFTALRVAHSNESRHSSKSDGGLPGLRVVRRSLGEGGSVLAAAEALPVADTFIPHPYPSGPFHPS
jgi:hypothetical protein